MNILFLSEIFFPHGGGAELATYLYAKLLSEKGENVKVVTNKYLSEPNIIKDGKLTIYRILLFPGNSTIKYKILFNVGIFLSPFFKKLVAWADIVYIPRYWFSAIPVAKAFGKPVLLHMHDYVLVCPLHGLYNFSKKELCQSASCFKCIFAYEYISRNTLKNTIASTFLNSMLGIRLRKLIELSDEIVCVSNAQKTLICSRIPEIKTKTSVIYNPLPIGCYPIQSEGEAFGFLGGSNPIKGFQVLHSALYTIKTSERVRLHAAKFQGLTNSPIHKSLANADIFFYGKLDSTSLNRLYKDIRTIIFPSICPEPLPYAISESILKNRLVIASHIGGSPEIARECKGVSFFESENIKELAEKIEYNLNLSREIVCDLTAQSRQVFLKNFNNELTLRKFVNLCNKIIHDQN